MLEVTLKDLVTGETKVYPSTNLDVWQWTEANWSCDCNRVMAFRDIDWDSPCECTRYIVVSAKGDLEGYTEQEFISECNREYSKES